MNHYFKKIISNFVLKKQNNQVKSKNEFTQLFQEKVIKIRTIKDLSDFYGWNISAHIECSDYPVEPGKIWQINQRRFKDHLVIANAALNAPTGDVVEIGTSKGETTALLSKLRPNSVINTLDILPYQTNEGKHITHILDENQIGEIYKAKKCKNVRQILGDTAHWTPDISDVAFAFIDGCHDFEYVINDTKKILSIAQPGAYICWHDFNPELIKHFHWIDPVCNAIDKLLSSNVLKGPILFLEDSFTAIYQIPEDCNSSKI